MDGFITIILCVFIFLLVLYFITTILSVIGLYKVFQKAGVKGYKAFIPIYNNYILCQIVGISPWWIVVVFIALIIGVMISFLSFISTIASIYFNILLCVSVARSFGKKDDYALGLYFLGFIFYPILGFGSSKYLGPKPMHDILFAENKKKDQVSKDDNVFGLNQSNHCPNCGYLLIIDSKYCPKCGKEL